MSRKVGGQAVFEGVMMRGDDRWAVAVRTPSGAIELMVADLPQRGGRWRKVPLVRGLLAIAEAIPLGMRAMRWSAANGLGRSPRPVVTAVRMLGFVAALLIVPPWAADRLGLPGGLVAAIVENLLTVVVLVAYAAAVGRLALLRRLFENHGAEHKVVAASEAGVDLTPESVAPFSTRHVRCGTSLLLVIAAVAAALSVLHLPTVVVVPLVAGISAELQLRASANVHRRWVRRLVGPGLALQRLTTREPSPAQIEVAIVAYRAAYDSIESAAQPSSVEAVAVPA